MVDNVRQRAGGGPVGPPLAVVYRTSCSMISIRSSGVRGTSFVRYADDIRVS